jgi:hypothetical protein
LGSNVGFGGFWHPGYRSKHWLAIIGVEVYRRNGREMPSVSNNRIGESRSQDWKTHMFSEMETYNFVIAGQTNTRKLGLGNE